MSALALLLLACGSAPAPAPAPEPAAAPAPAKQEEADPMAMHQPTEGARVWFIEPTEGATVSSPVKVVMGLEGMTILPAGEMKIGTGHHHLILDGEPTEFGIAVPADATHIHFGQGQTEAEVELSPGEHTLTLQFADGAHRSYGPSTSATIKVTVK